MLFGHSLIRIMVPVCHVQMGSSGVRAPVWIASGVWHWKRLFKISDGTDYYYCINHMTCSIYVYYCSYILVTLSAILFIIMSHVYFAFSVFSADMLFMYTNSLHFMYFLFHVFPADTLFMYNHKHDNMITTVYFMCRYSYLSSLHYHDTSAISINSK